MTVPPSALTCASAVSRSPTVKTAGKTNPRARGRARGCPRPDPAAASASPPPPHRRIQPSSRPDQNAAPGRDHRREIDHRETQIHPRLPGHCAARVATSVPCTSADASRRSPVATARSRRCPIQNTGPAPTLPAFIGQRRGAQSGPRHRAGVAGPVHGSRPAQQRPQRRLGQRQLHARSRDRSDATRRR